MHMLHLHTEDLAKVWFQRLTWPELFAEQNAGAPAAGLEGCKVLQKSFDLKFI